MGIMVECSNVNYQVYLQDSGVSGKGRLDTKCEDCVSSRIPKGAGPVVVTYNGRRVTGYQLESQKTS